MAAAPVGFRRGSESNEVFPGNQPQHLDFLRCLNAGFIGAQAIFNTARHLPYLKRHLFPLYSIIEEIVEGFVERFDLIDDDDDDDERPASLVPRRCCPECKPIINAASSAGRWFGKLGKGVFQVTARFPDVAGGRCSTGNVPHRWLPPTEPVFEILHGRRKREGSPRQGDERKEHLPPAANSTGSSRGGKIQSTREAVPICDHVRRAADFLSRCLMDK